MGRRQRWILGLAALALSAALCGCTAEPTDDLYALPRQSDLYYDLQTSLDSVLSGGASYAGPLTGGNQQAVQLADLDGDGQDEVIVFLRTSGEKPLKAYIYDLQDGHYENTAVLDGDGSAFDAVEYAQIDGQPGLEIVVGRQLSDQILQSLSVYTYAGGRLKELMHTNYTEFTVADMDQDQRKDLVVFRLQAEMRGGVAELYRYDGDTMEREREASLSTGVRQIQRILTGYVSKGVPAVFVASLYEENTILTDIFLLREDGLANVAANAETGISTQTVRNYNVYASDIDEDGLIELPMPVALPSAVAGEETQWMIDWFNLEPDGTRRVKRTTYHNYAGGWYLQIPVRWRGNLTVARSSDAMGAVAYAFSKWNGYDQDPEPILTIYALTGGDRLELAQRDGRFLLAEKGETVYAASLGQCGWAGELTQDDVSEMFRFIYLDWDSGER